MTALSSRYTYEGTETTETSITRVGSPADPTGTLQSRKLVTTANSQWLRPFKAEPYVAWNGVTDTTVTATVYGVVNGGVLPNNDELWMDVEHLKASSGVLGTIVTTTKANVLASGTAVSSDSSTWNNATPTRASFDGTPSDPSVVTSNGNLTVRATSSAAQSDGVMGTMAMSSGKYYFEITADAVHAGAHSVGILQAGRPITDFGATSNVVMVSGIGDIYSNDTGFGKNIGAPTNGSITCFSINFDTRRAWLRRNNGNWNNDATADPVAGIGGAPIEGPLPYVVAVYFGITPSAGDGITANFGATAYAYTPPAGYVDWINYTSFKLTATLDLNATAPIAGNSTPVTFDPATVANVTLSGGNLVATNTGTTSQDQGARVAAAAAKNVGKYYFEFTFTSYVGGGSVSVGVATPSISYTALPDDGAVAVAINGYMWCDSVLIDNLASFTTGTVVGVALDLDNYKIWFRIAPSGIWNGTAFNGNPATGVGGITVPRSLGSLVPVCTFGGASGVANNITTANFGASSFTGAVPSGFTSGWPTSLAVPSYSAPVGYIEARVRAAKASTTYYIDPTIELSPSGATAGATAAYKTSRYAYEGTETTETSITRVNGAADPTGQQQSRKIVTTANSQWLRPFKAEPYAQWSNVTGADVTVTVCGTVNSGALPLNDEIWMDVEYLGDASSVLGKIVTTTKANVLATGTSVTSDSSTWSTSATSFDGTPINITMSNGNLTGTHSNTSVGGVGSTIYVSGGKYYFEMTLQVYTASNCSIGLLLAGGAVTDTTSSANTVIVLVSTTSTVFANSVNTAKTLGSASVGHVIGVAVDSTARLAWFRLNNGNWNGDGAANPATGAGGVSFTAGAYAPYFRFGNSGSGGSDAVTVNFGSVAFANAAPSGFLSWDTAWTPFKLTTTLSSPQPGVAGYIHVRPRVAKASTTYYIDPQINLS